MGDSSILKKVPGAKGFLGFVRKTSGLRAVVGDKAFSSMDLAGQLAGVYDDQLQAGRRAADPNRQHGLAAMVERDRVRRLAKRASGLDSTIRTSPAGALYSAQPAAEDAAR
jgi:hypothetical protein